MALAGQVSKSFLYVAEKRPVLVFEDEAQARKLRDAFSGAEIYGNKTHVFLPTPHGLELVCSGNGETAYGNHAPLKSCCCDHDADLILLVFHDSHQAKDWFNRLSGYGVMYPEGDHPSRTVYAGKKGHWYGGEPIYPGVA
jgi:NADH pyrophosphatase NudC (nudix superfamily)